MKKINTNPFLMALFTFIGTMAAATGASCLFGLITNQPFSISDPLVLISSGIIAIVPAITVFLKTNMLRKHPAE